MNQMEKSPSRNIMASRQVRCEYNLVDNFDMSKERSVSELWTCRKGRVSEATMDKADLFSYLILMCLHI